MSTLYSTKVKAVGGRNGTVRSEDGLLELKLALPRSLGGKGDATNPEQLFAAGYAACFENAILHILRGRKQTIADDAIEVTAEVGLSPNAAGGFVLGASLAVTIANMQQKDAEELVAAAHAVCPYSNAVRGNVDVAIAVHTR